MSIVIDFIHATFIPIICSWEIVTCGVLVRRVSPNVAWKGCQRWGAATSRVRPSWVCFLMFDLSRFLESVLKVSRSD